MTYPTWTEEEIADYKRWEAEFGKPSQDPEHDEWLDFMDAEITWGQEIPSA